MHRVALALTRGASAREDRIRDDTGQLAPRSHIFDENFFPVWDETLLDKPGAVGRGPEWWRLALEVQRLRSDYDAIVTWGEKLSLAVTMQQRLGISNKPHIAMMYYFQKPNISLPLRFFGKSLHAIVTWSSVQRRYLIDQLGFPAQKVYMVRHFVDQVFYSPRQTQEDMICAVGAEMRDYQTLIRAVRGTGLSCHIATDHVRIPRRVRLIKDRHVPIDALCKPCQEGQLTAGPLPLVELRRLYARSRFVVVPLLSSDADNGLNVILEAMAMGKPVICSQTRGQVDVIEDGVTGMYVPVGDSSALRAAMLSLWNNPTATREMGQRARAYVEAHHSLELFASGVRSAVEASLEGRPAPDTWWTA